MSFLSTSRARVVAGLSTVATVAALGAVAPAPATAAPSTQDAAYLAFAARSNLAEIALGKIARKNAGDRDVAAYGKDMVEDHQAQLATVRATVASLGITLPTKPSKQQRQIARQWARLDGRAFDCAYVPFQWGDHQLVITTTQTEIAQGSDPAVTQAASGALPVLEEHDEHATMLLGDLRC
jgi:putative membrane protein